jgi:uncharacterized protein (TIGR04255 family)
MKQAPLIYAVGMLQFPRVPDFERFINEFMESIRKEYPIDDRCTVQTFHAQVSPEGIKIDPIETKLWQFSSFDRKWSFVLNDQAFFLHTANYHDFAGFLERFEAGITALIQLGNIDIRWMSSIGLRYVNMVAPLKGGNIREYLNSWVLPTDVPNIPLEIIQGVHSIRFKTDHGGLRLQVLLNPTFTLPPELNSPFVIKNAWIKNRPSSEFSLIDIDHTTAWAAPIEFSIATAVRTLADLRTTSKTIFNSIGTEKAIKLWGKP